MTPDISTDCYQLYHGDCLVVLSEIEAGSVDMIATDLPYGVTQCKWDSIIPLEPMWAQVKRLLKPRGVFVTTASQPFTSMLVMSNLEWFRYEWVWEKSRSTGHLDANLKPLRSHENIVIFSREALAAYNPQMIAGNSHKRGCAKRNGRTEVYGAFNDALYTSSEYYPNSIIKFSCVQNPEHPTQKPIALYDYLIRTYTNYGDTVLDFCMGSGTTGCAALSLGRRFIGVELYPVKPGDPDYFGIATRRIADAAVQPPLPMPTQEERETPEQSAMFDDERE